MADTTPHTNLVQAGHFVDPATGAVVPPIHPSTTYARDSDHELVGNYIYSRNQNPTFDLVEDVACDLDNGAAAKVFASGMAAISAVLDIVPTGGRVVAPRVMYHGSQAAMRRLAETRDVELAWFDAADPNSCAAVIAGGPTSLVWIETPVNPTWDVIDIQYTAQLSRDAGSLLVVDSTVSPPVTTRPIDLGAHLVVHSATKYYNGHSDVTAGLVVTATTDVHWDQITASRTVHGGVLGPFEAWLLLRGMRTLFLRYERCCENAMAIAEHFADDPRIEKVLYPGLASHPGHEIAVRQMTNGFGGMLSLLVRGTADDARRVAAATQVFSTATSLGGIESLIEHRASVEGPHSAVPPNLLRLSVGIESVDDLIRDLDRALGLS